MNSKTSEYFHESIIALYKEMAHEAILESEVEARSHLDHKVLEDRIREMISSAKFDGLSEAEIKAIIDETVREWLSHHKKEVV